MTTTNLYEINIINFQIEYNDDYELKEEDLSLDLTSLIENSIFKDSIMNKKIKLKIIIKENDCYEYIPNLELIKNIKFLNIIDYKYLEFFDKDKNKIELIKSVTNNEGGIAIDIKGIYNRIINIILHDASEHDTSKHDASKLMFHNIYHFIIDFTHSQSKPKSTFQRRGAIKSVRGFKDSEINKIIEIQNEIITNLLKINNFI